MEFNTRFVNVPSGNSYHVVDEPPAGWVGPLSDAPTVFCAHGFPDLELGWAHQIRAFSKHGFRVIVPTQLGYHPSSIPALTEAYSWRSIAYDMDQLLDEVIGTRGKQVFVLGHDWGGVVAWRFADYFPHRVLSLISVCTPYTPPARPGQPYIPAETLIRKHLPNFGYQLYFGGPSAELEMPAVGEFFLAPAHSKAGRAVRRAAAKEAAKKAPGQGKPSWVLEGMLQKHIHGLLAAKDAGKLPALPDDDAEFNVYRSRFSTGGWKGPLQYYKTREVNYKEETASELPPFFPASIPCLFIPCTADAALPLEMSKGMEKHFPGGNLEIRPFDGADHWVLKDEATRDKITSWMVDWVEEVKDGQWKPSKAKAKI